MNQLAHLEKMTLVQKRDCSQRKWVFKACTGFSSHSFDYKDNKDSLWSNNSPNEPFFELPKILPLKTSINVTQYIRKDLEKIIQIVF